MCKGFRVLGILLALTVGVSVSAQAGNIALTFTGGQPFFGMVGPLPLTIGWEFSLSTPVIVTQLGFYDVGNNGYPPPGDGLLVSHPVAIWDVSTQTLMASATVPQGTSAPLDQDFRWVSVSPFTLAAGTYRIGAEIAVNGENYDDFYYSDTDTRTTAYPVNYNSGALLQGAFGYPDSSGDVSHGRFGPNFQFNAVPEPSTMLLIGSGLVGLWGARKKFKK